MSLSPRSQDLLSPDGIDDAAGVPPSITASVVAVCTVTLTPMPTPLPDEPSFIDQLRDNPLTLPVAGGLLALLAGCAATPVAPGPAQPTPIPAPAPPPPVYPPPTQQPDGQWTAPVELLPDEERERYRQSLHTPDADAVEAIRAQMMLGGLTADLSTLDSGEWLERSAHRIERLKELENETLSTIVVDSSRS